MGAALRKVTKDELHQVYEMKQVIGKGSFARVKLAIRREDGKPFAVKIIRKKYLSEEALQVVYEEISILQKIEHPNCVRLYDTFESKSKVYMIMELMSGGEVFHHICEDGSFSEMHAARIVRDVATALKGMHAAKIVHRDIKPENLLYSSPEKKVVKVADFGLAKIKDRGVILRTACGTPDYVAPEVLAQQPYDEACDLWSLGVITYVMLCGYTPFEGQTPRELYKNIIAANYLFPDTYWGNISAEAKDLIRRLLVPNPRQRLKVDEVLAHPWIRNNISQKLDRSGAESKAARALSPTRTSKRRPRRTPAELIDSSDSNENRSESKSVRSASAKAS